MASRLPAETGKKPSPVSNHVYSSTGAKFTRVTNPPPLSAKAARCVGYASVLEREKRTVWSWVEERRDVGCRGQVVGFRVWGVE